MSLSMIVFVGSDAARQTVFIGVRFFSVQFTGPSASRGSCPYLVRLSKTCAAARKPSSWPLSNIGRESGSSTSDKYRYQFVSFPVEQWLVCPTYEEGCARPEINEGSHV